MYVNNYLFLITLLHVSMFTRLPQEISCNVCKSNKLMEYKLFHKLVVAKNLLVKIMSHHE